VTATTDPKVQLSVTDVEVTLEQLGQDPHAIVVLESTEAQEPIVCGDVAGSSTSPNAVTVRLVGQGGSGYTGMAVLRGGGQTTNVELTLTPPADGEGPPAFAPLHPLPAEFYRVGPPVIRIQPRSDRLENRRQTFALSLGQCGLSSPVDVDGSLWDPIGGNDPSGGPIDTDDEAIELVNETAGEAVLVGPRRMDFLTPIGSVIVFARHQGPGRYQPCA
jgi:hypothetical protein